MYINIAATFLCAAPQRFESSQTNCSVYVTVITLLNNFLSDSQISHKKHFGGSLSEKIAANARPETDFHSSGLMRAHKCLHSIEHDPLRRLPCDRRNLLTI
jgi:hypothetical protein